MFRTVPLRVWILIHKWTSLVCILFLLLICVTGLLIIFHTEIDDVLRHREYASLPANTPSVPIDRLVDVAKTAYPGEVIASVSISHDDPVISIDLAPSGAALKADPSVSHTLRFDSRTAQILERSNRSSLHGLTFADLSFRLHSRLFAGLPGELFLASMALLFLVATVSGLALYRPFAQKQRFGAVRVGRSSRVKWLDLHNFLGVVTVAWALVVGATGIMNELSVPLFNLWRHDDLGAALQAWQGRPPVCQDNLASLQDVVTTVGNVLPSMMVTGVTFPGSPAGSPYHYLVWTKGRTPLTAQLFDPVLVDAQTGKLTAIVHMPWYLRALEVSRPLHFGNYGGLPLKIIWTLLDLVTIVVLGSGLYLWLSRRWSPIEARIAELELFERGAESARARNAAE